MAFRRRYSLDINNSIQDIIRTEFPGVPVYQANDSTTKSMFFRINKVSDELNEIRRTSSDRNYNISLQFYIKNFYPRKRNKGLDMGMRNAERLRQLLFSYRNQLLASKKFFTSSNETFVLAGGGNFNVRKNQDDLYNYHDLNVNNVSINVEESKNYYIFDFNIDANIEKAVTS
jgi:hypothetical protein